MNLRFFYFGKAAEVTVQEQELLRRIGFRCPIQMMPLSQAGRTEGTLAKKEEGTKLFAKIEDQDFFPLLHPIDLQEMR